MFFPSNIIFGQQIPIDHYLENIIENSLDNGLNWEFNTTFGLFNQRKINQMNLGNYDYSKNFYSDKNGNDSSKTKLIQKLF